MPHSLGISSHIITNSEGHAALKCAQCPNLYRSNLADEPWHPTITNLQHALLRSFETSLWTYDKATGPFCPACSEPPHA